MPPHGGGSGHADDGAAEGDGFRHGLIALECEKRLEKDRIRVLDEPLWSMYCNGKKSGYGVKREPTEEDLSVMELLKMVSMGAGILPGTSNVEGQDGELAYMRAHFERVVGSRDSETLYMLSPDGKQRA